MNPPLTALQVAIDNHEQLHRKVRELGMLSLDELVEWFTHALGDELPEEELTRQVIISAIAEIELRYYS